MKIGFTGTQQGMSPAQAAQLRDSIQAFINQGHVINEFHHGDCVGADAEAHEIAREFEGIEIVVHPPTIPHKQAFCHGDRTMVNKPYLQRNRCIVDSVEVLIAAPKTDTPIMRSGTWATVRYALKRNTPVIQLTR